MIQRNQLNKYLETLTKREILDLFEEMDIESVRRFYEMAFKYCEEYIPPDDIDQLSDDEDALELDNARRYREWESDNKEPY